MTISYLQFNINYIGHVAQLVTCLPAGRERYIDKLKLGHIAQLVTCLPAGRERYIDKLKLGHIAQLVRALH